MSNLQGWPQLQRRMRALGETRPLMRALQVATIAEAHKRVPKKTGNLARSIGPGKLSDTEASIVARARYAAYVERGTRPHIIRPRNKKALAWAATGGGRRLSGRARVGAQRGQLGGMRFAKLVHHPGTKAQPFMVPAAQAAIEQGGLSSIVVSLWNGAA